MRTCAPTRRGRLCCGQDHTLVRKPDSDTAGAYAAAANAYMGGASPSEALWEYTSVTQCQWDIYAQNTHTYVGQHTASGAAV